jgi:hypothetical protein
MLCGAFWRVPRPICASNHWQKSSQRRTAERLREDDFESEAADIGKQLKTLSDSRLIERERADRRAYIDDQESRKDRLESLMFGRWYGIGSRGAIFIRLSLLCRLLRIASP